MICPPVAILIHWGRMTHIFVNKLTIISSDNNLSPEQHQAIIWTNSGILLIGTSSAKLRPFCIGLDVLRRSWVKQFLEIKYRSYRNSIIGSSVVYSCYMFEMAHLCIADKAVFLWRAYFAFSVIRLHQFYVCRFTRQRQCVNFSKFMKSDISEDLIWNNIFSIFGYIII